MTAATQSPTKASARANNPAGDGGDISVGFDIFRLDCVVDALRGADLTANDRAELARIAANLADIMEPMQ